MKKVIVLISENSINETKFCLSISFDMEDSIVYGRFYCTCSIITSTCERSHYKQTGNGQNFKNE